MTNKNFIECGRIINTHGCKGGIKIDPWCNSEQEFLNFARIFILKNDSYTEYKIKKASQQKQFIIAELEGIADMDTAISLKGNILYAAREDFDLAEGEFFIADMIGLDVIDSKSGKKYGTLSQIMNRGASDIYVVSTDKGEVLIPAVDEFIDHVDIQKGIFISPISGMFD